MLMPPCWYWTQVFKEVENWILSDCRRSNSSVGSFVFREPERTKLFETDSLAAAPTHADEVKMDVQKGYGTKGTYGHR